MDTRRASRIPALLFGCLGALPVGRLALAQEQDESEAERAQELYLEGMTLYRAGKYRLAVGRFDEAYRLLRDPRLIYNMARSYEATGNIAAATPRYLQCIEDPATDDELRQKALKRLRLIESTRAQGTAMAANIRDPLNPSVTRAHGPPDRSGWLGVSKWLVGGLGLGLLGGGAALWGLGRGDVAELNESRTPEGQVSTLSRVQAAELAANAEKRQTAGLVLIGAGAAAAVTSVILFVLDGKAGAARVGDHRAKGASGAHRGELTVVPSKDGGALVFTETF